MEVKKAFKVMRKFMKKHINNEKIIDGAWKVEEGVVFRIRYPKDHPQHNVVEFGPPGGYLVDEEYNVNDLFCYRDDHDKILEKRTDENRLNIEEYLA